MRILVLMAGALLLLSLEPSAALTVRGDELWRSNRSCPQGWSARDADESAWLGAEYPWYYEWPTDWEPDRGARLFWGEEPGNTCVRRHFHLDTVPPGQAIAHLWVDDDYEFYLNGSLIGSSNDREAPMPGEAYDVTPSLQAGDNVIAIRLIRHHGPMGALFSLTVPGLPDPPLMWFQIARRVVPWVQFVSVAFLLAIVAFVVARLRSILLAPLRRLSPGRMALLIALVAVFCQAILTSQVFYQGMTEIIPLVAMAWTFPMAHWNWPAVTAVASLFLLLVILCGATDAPAELAPTRRAERVALTAVLLMAVILRTYRIDSIPVGFYQDEAINGNDAFNLLQFYPADGLRVWSYSIGGRPTLFLYLVGVCVHLFGNSYLSLKIVPVLFGVATVGAVYALGRVAFGRREALWAAFFLAVSRWHIHYSRMAWEAICVPFFSTAGFALLLHGLRRERGGGVGLAAGAVVLSAGLYTYASYRAIPLVALVFFLAVLLSSDRRVVLRREALAGLFAGSVLAAAAVAPLALFAWREPKMYWQRYDEVSLTSYMAYLGTPMPWVHTLGKGLLSFNAQGDQLIRHNLPLAAHLDMITGGVFLVGLAAAARAWRSLGVRLVWVWFLVFLAVVTLTREVPHATRLLGLAPVAALFAAFGTTRLLALLGTNLRGLARRVVVAGLVLATIGLNSFQYFIVEANDPAADADLDLTGRTLCEYVRQLGEVDVYWTSDVAFFSGAQCRFLARGHFTDNDLTLERARHPTFLRRERPIIAVIGSEFLDDHRNEIRRAEDGRPLLAFAVEPVVQRDREGKAMYYLYRF